MTKLTLLFVITSFAAHAFGMGYGVSKTRTASGQEVNVLRLEGQVVIMEWRGWQQAIVALDPNLDTIVYLSSPGGNASHGLFMLGRVEEFQETWKANGHRVVAVAERDCSSMCVPLYYAFENRLAVTGTRFGIHAVHDELGPNPEFTQAYIKNLNDRAEARGDSDMLNWVRSKVAEGAFETAKLVATSADELARIRSGIVSIDAIVSNEDEGLARSFPGK